MNRSERIYKIHNLMKGKTPCPLKTFIRETGVGRSTLYRDFSYMMDFMRAPIVYDKKTRGRFYDPDAEEYELPGFWLNSSELYALRVFQKILETSRAGILQKILSPLKDRIDSQLKMTGHSPESLMEKVSVSPLYSRMTDETVFSGICEALINDRIVEVTYLGRNRNEKTVRKLHPQRIIYYRNNWYLLAWCEKAAEIRLFSIDRLKIDKISSQTCKCIPHEELDSASEESFGIFTGKAENTARLRFSDPSARWVKDEIWHRNQKMAWEEDTLVLEIPYGNPAELVREILKHGSGVIVESPEELKNQIKKELVATLGLY